MNVTLTKAVVFTTPDSSARIRMAAGVRSDRQVGYVRITAWVKGQGIVKDMTTAFKTRDEANEYWAQAAEGFNSVYTVAQ